MTKLLVGVISYMSAYQPYLMRSGTTFLRKFDRNLFMQEVYNLFYMMYFLTKVALIPCSIQVTIVPATAQMKGVDLKVIMKSRINQPLITYY